MYYTADGKQAFADEIELLIEEIALEKLYEQQTNNDSSKFWIQVADTISGFTLGGFLDGFEEFKKALLYNGAESKDLFDYAMCFAIRMRAKPFAAKALETTLVHIDTMRSVTDFAEVLDRNYSNLDPLAEVLLFFKIYGRVIERRCVELAGGQVRLPRVTAQEE